MLLRDIIIWVFTIIGMINFIHLGLYITGANIYDILQLRRGRPAKKKFETPLPPDPHVTVLIPAHNEEMGVINTIETVRKNTYRNLSIVVIDDASTDNTAQLVRDYIAKNATKTVHRLKKKGGKQVRVYERLQDGLPPITLLAREKNAGKAAGLNYALANAVRDGLTMTLDADSALEPHAIERAVKYFRDPKIVGVAANVQIVEQHTVLGMLQKFEHMVGYRSKKFYTLTNSEFIIGGVASTYRYDVLKRVGFYDTDTQTEDIGLSMKIMSEGNRDQRIIYAADVVARTEGVQTYKALFRQRYRWKLGSLQNLLKYRSMFGNIGSKYSKMLTLYRIPMAFLSELTLLLQPFILGYVTYLSFAYHTLSILIGGYVTITLYVLWTIWPDEHHTYIQKATLSLYAPIMYFIFFIMDAVQINAIIRCLLNIKQLSSKRDTSSTWISPTRAGAINATQSIN
jgi:cellulose synthase/poly-beta-1,6-N-acetylglucosamine synthase-like glycosyltransferase